MINLQGTSSRSVSCFIKNNFGGFACYDNTITVIIFNSSGGGGGGNCGWC